MIRGDVRFLRLRGRQDVQPGAASLAFRPQERAVVFNVFLYAPFLERVRPSDRALSFVMTARIRSSLTSIAMRTPPERSRGYTPWRAWQPGCAIGVVVFLHIAYYGPRVVDDMFISLRYAESLAHGHGAVFNAGERVEGYSSPAWMVLQALGLFGQGK